MITTSRQPRSSKKDGVVSKSRSYGAVIDYLDSCRVYEYSDKSVQRMKALDKVFDNASTKIDTILVGGTNGKSTAIHFASKLLQAENFKVGTSFSTHFLTYNERLAFDGQPLTMMSLLYSKAEGADVVLLEVGLGGRYDATSICNPLIATITRVATDHVDVLGDDLDEATQEMLYIAKKGTWFVSAEQSKLRLQKMKIWAEERGVTWTMPIRKLASLPYIHEQLYGRVASLGERIAQIYVEEIKGKFSPFLRGNLLATKRGQRGRPTLEAKRQAELNPVKTLKTFWSDNYNLLRGRFEVLDKEKPTILLDNASNIDAFDNVFLGIRLLHYQRPLKGLVLVMGLDKSVNLTEAVKLIRYLLKKVTGQVFFVSLPDSHRCHRVQDIIAVAKELNVKAKGYDSFEEALEAAKALVDDRQGLVGITGSSGMVSRYWKHRGIKKL